jgi:hypothetical protein
VPREPSISGPFQPALNADVGFPTEVAVEDYGELRRLVSGVTYRLLDAHFEDGVLTFTWSQDDLWHEWCALQQPFRWDIAGHGFHFCVPQGESAQASFDEGKVVLCTPADFESLCSESPSIVLPCSCMSGGPRARRCGPPMCHCDATGCRSNLRVDDRARLTLVDGRLSGPWADPGFEEAAPEVTLERVTP